MRVDLARQRFGSATGKGLVIGIISDGCDGLDTGVWRDCDHFLSSNSFLLAAAVPADTLCLQDFSPYGAEGTAMAEVVHAVAPEAKLIITGTGYSIPDYVAAIQKLVDLV
jgi:hypothetical protein